MSNLTEANQYEDQLLKETEAAKMLSISVRTIQNWRVRGGGPVYVKMSGKSVRYRMGDLLTWIDESKCTSTSEEALVS